MTERLLRAGTSELRRRHGVPGVADGRRSRGGSVRAVAESEDDSEPRALGTIIGDPPQRGRSSVDVGSRVWTARGANEVPAGGSLFDYLDAGNVVFVATVGEVSCDVHVNLFDPAGEEFPYSGGCVDVGRIDVATSGKHRLVVTTTVTFTGSYGFEVLEFRPDLREALAMGATASGTIDAPGARDIWEVDAAPGQQLIVRGVPGPCVLFLRPFDTSGSALQGLLSPCVDLPFTAPVDGQVEIWVFSLDRKTDDYTFRLEGV